MSRLLPASGRAVDEVYVAGLADEATGMEGRFDTGRVAQLMDSAVDRYEQCVSLPVRPQRSDALALHS